VSMLVECWLHNGQKIDEKVLGQKNSFLQFPMYWPFLNIRIFATKPNVNFIPLAMHISIRLFFLNPGKCNLDDLSLT
jgi:hypothetical protein